MSDAPMDRFGMKYATKQQRADKALVLAACAHDGAALEFADVSLKKDADVVLAAVTQQQQLLRNPKLGKWAMLRKSVLKVRSPKMMLVAAKMMQRKRREEIEAKRCAVLEFAHFSLRVNRGFMLKAVATCGWALEFCSPALKKDKEVVLTAVGAEGGAILYAPPSMKQDKDVVLAAMAQDPLAFKYADVSLRQNLEIVLAACAMDGDLLRFAEPGFRANKEAMLAVIVQDNNGVAFKHVDESLRQDSAFLFAAVRALQTETLMWKAKAEAGGFLTVDTAAAGGLPAVDGSPGAAESKGEKREGPWARIFGAKGKAKPPPPPPMPPARVSSVGV